MSDIKALADFEDGEAFDEIGIREWALRDEGGGLPDVSALPFARWLDQTWNDFDDGSGTLTNEDVLNSALEHWTGRS